MSDLQHDLTLLAHCEQELTALRHECARLPRQIDELEALAQAVRDSIAAARGELEEAEKARRGREADIEDSRAQREQFQGRTAVVKTNEEYHALLREIEGVDVKISGLEDQVLELMERIEDRAARLAEVEKDQGAVEADLQRQIDERRAELQRAEERRVQVTQERDVIVPRLGDRVARIYQQVAARGGTPVARIEKGNCSACHRSIPPQVINLVKASELHTCMTCHAILTPEPEDD
jgi:predicted CXXCH cytochrome family protein